MRATLGTFRDPQESAVLLGSSRKEVIQPQVPLRLPCYDFTPVTGHTLGSYFLCRLAH